MWREPIVGSNAPDTGDDHLWTLLASHPQGQLVTGDQLLLDNPPSGILCDIPSSFSWIRFCPRKRIDRIFFSSHRRRVGPIRASVADRYKIPLIFGLPVRLQRLVQKGVEQVAAGIVACGEAHFQLVAEGHQFINFGDDAVFFGQGREGD